MSSSLTTLLPSIVISPTGAEISTQRHNDRNDDYLRFGTSPVGQYLASVSNRRQLTLFDLKDRAQFSNWSEENVTHLAFSQQQTQFAVLSRSPSVKLFQITSNNGAKSVNLVHELKSQASATNFGWVVWSLDNKFIYYAKNEDLFGMNVRSLEEFPLSADGLVRAKCAPHYLLIDRGSKRLVSASRNGLVCTYEIETLPQKPAPLFPKPSVKLLQSTRLSTSTITIANFGQGKDFIIASTTAITQNRQTFFSTYIISKLNINQFWRTQLRQELIVPPLMMQADNVEDYLVAFLKGERSLYVYDLGEVLREMKKQTLALVSGEGASLVNVRVLAERQKMEVPYLLHAVSFNKVSNKLLLGTTAANNLDRILEVELRFNCSSIGKSQQSNLPAIRQFCTEECQSVSLESYFSFLEGRCKARPPQLSQLQKECSLMGDKYEWSRFGEDCELKCERVENSVSKLSYGSPQECTCGQNYVWSGTKSICESVNMKPSGSQSQSTNPTANSNSSSTAANNTSGNNIANTQTNNTSNNTTSATANNAAKPTQNNQANNKPENTTPTNPPIVPPAKPPAVNPINPPPIITPTVPQAPNNNQPTKPNNTPASPFDNNPAFNNLANNDKNNTTTVVLSIFSVLLIVAIGIGIYLYKKKKLCFKASTYVQDNQLKQSDIKSSQSNQIDKKPSQTSTHEHKQPSKDSSKSLDLNTKQPNPIIAPVKQFNLNHQLNQPVDQFVLEEIISDLDNEENDYKVDSERKFYS